MHASALIYSLMLMQKCEYYDVTCAYKFHGTITTFPHSYMIDIHYVYIRMHCMHRESGFEVGIIA